VIACTIMSSTPADWPPGQGNQMILMRVDAAITEQPDEVQTVAARLGKGFDQDWIRCQFAVLDRLINSREILIDNTPRAKIEVADFAVAICPRADPHPSRLH